ncbi:WXG100 family type VII secretion target [Nocardia sp. NPDC051570]|uniref:WXG100 family type VII secretion target n=1 Tax=Nocardia sp. NPDC051570 TaxID=3364324 RepID=UPI0037AE87BF
MLYDPNTVNNLITDLGTYHTQISTERQNAIDAATKLTSQAWQGTSSVAFKQKHDTLMTDLQDLLDTLAKGKQHVQDALSRAQHTDTKVADDFTW